MRLFPFLPCHYSSEVFEAAFFFLQAQGLHSIWLMWKQMCFRRADWAFIAALRKLGFTVSVALKENDSQVPEKLFCVTVSLLVHRRYTLRQQSV